MQKKKRKQVVFYIPTWQWNLFVLYGGYRHYFLSAFELYLCSVFELSLSHLTAFMTITQD